LIHDWNDKPFLDIYLLKNGDESKATKFNSKVNTKFHESTAVFTKDGSTVYFTRNNYTNNDLERDSQGVNRLKLYRGTLRDDSWKIIELPFNSHEYSVAHPALSVDESTLYFASDMPGGKGLSDLYKVSINGDDYGTPVNLGDGINTEGRETFPFISADNKLYFASDGHVGLGGLDVFASEINENEGRLGKVFNLGKPINSTQDDFTFIINSETGLGYFASNREGGKGDDDIYSFNATKFTPDSPEFSNCSQTVKGEVRDENTNLILAEASVYLLNNSNDVLAETVSAADGSFEFPVNCVQGYCVRSVKDGYTTAEKCFATGNKLDDNFNKTLFMAKGINLGSTTPAGVGADLVKILGLNPIYFDLDKDFIRPDAEIELRKVIAVMELYPNMKIDVRSHTDSRSPDDYNIDLSKRRARQTINYLVERGGIASSRLTGDGYGETRLMNKCSNGVACSESEHQLNRRSEFIIVK